MREGWESVGYTRAGDVVDMILALDEIKRRSLTQAERLRAKMKQEGKPTDAAARARLAMESGLVKVFRGYADSAKEELDWWMLRVPNLPHPDAPGAPQGRYREVMGK